MIKIATNIIIFSIFLSCSIYQDDKEPEIFFQYSDFEILELGKTFSDMILSSNDNSIFLSDYNNNAILKVNTQNALELEQITIVGSHPIAFDISSDNSTLAITHEGESTILLIDIQTMEIVNSFSGIKTSL